MKKVSNIKIFVAHHKPWYIYEDDIYVPIQVWKKNAKVDLWILWDDTGDNISEKNSNYAELTAQYWVWKNYDLSDVDYVWFCHYRRYMVYNYKYNKLRFRSNFNSNYSLIENIISIYTYISGKKINKSFNKDEIYSYSNSIKSHLKKKEKDILFLTKWWITWLFPKSAYNFWLVDKDLWNILHRIIIRQDPCYEKTIKNMQNVNIMYGCNMWIFKKDVFIEYCNWLFWILFKLEKEIKNKNLEIICLKEPMTAWTRFMWCLWERLFNLYLCHKKEQWYTISKKANMIYFKDI